jgi:hypothetical protein
MEIFIKEHEISEDFMGKIEAGVDVVFCSPTMILDESKHAAHENFGVVGLKSLTPKGFFALKELLPFQLPIEKEWENIEFIF